MNVVDEIEGITARIGVAVRYKSYECEGLGKSVATIVVEVGEGVWKEFKMKGEGHEPFLARTDALRKLEAELRNIYCKQSTAAV